MSSQPLPDTDGAARFVGTTARNLRRWIDKGLDVPVIRLSRRVIRFDQDDLHQWVVSLKQSAARNFDASR